MNVLDAIVSRKSIRAYTGEQIAEEELQAILKAAYAAAVGMAKYDTLHLTVIQDPALLAEIDRNAADFFNNPDAHPLYGAPTLIVVSTCENGNVPSANVAMLVHSMALEAVELGIGHVDIYGATAGLAMNPDLVAKLGLPEGFVPTGSIALGKTDETYVPREIPERIGLNRI